VLGTKLLSKYQMLGMHATRSAGRPLLEVSGLEKSYRKPRRKRRARQLITRWFAKREWANGTIEVPVLRGLDLSVAEGEFLAVVGASGSGKSTLLHLLGALDRPDAGKIWLAGRRIDNLGDRQRNRLRNEVFGFIFQFYHLLPELTALENVLLPLMVRHGVFSYWRRRRRLRRQAMELLERVGLLQRARHRPAELSGGEMQRVAIARALASQPQILLADEPTGNLDRQTSIEIFQLLHSLNQDEGLTIIMVTHDLSLARGADRCLHLANGRLEPAGFRAAHP